MAIEPETPSLETQRQHWDVWNAQYRVEIGDDCRARGAKALELLDRLNLTRPRVLEVGCSTGWLCEELAKRGEVTGVDLSGAAIEVARRRVSDARFEAGDFASLRFEPGSFDAVVSLETIAHVPDKSMFVERIADLLRPGGHLVITSQNARIWERSGVLKRPKEILQELLTMADLKRLLEPRFAVVKSGTIIPFGRRGSLRVVNSPRVNRVVGRVVGQARWRGAKERLGLGNTLFALARKRA